MCILCVILDLTVTLGRLAKTTVTFPQRDARGSSHYGQFRFTLFLETDGDILAAVVFAETLCGAFPRETGRGCRTIDCAQRALQQHQMSVNFAGVPMEDVCDVYIRLHGTAWVEREMEN